MNAAAHHWGSIRQSLSSSLPPISFLILILGIFAFFIPSYFFSPDNILNMLSSGASFGFAAVALSIVIISGNMDLSIGAIVSFSCTMTGLLIAQKGLPIVPACLIVTLASMLLGYINGLLIRFTKLNSLIITYLSQAVFNSISFLLCNGQPITGLPERFSYLGRGHLFGIPISFLLLLLVLVCTNFVLNHSYYGKYIFAIGCNQTAARLAGINVNQTRCLVFAVSGLLSGICGIILCSRINYGLPTAGEDYTFTSLAITILSGITLTGGYGSVLNIVFGVLTYSAISTGLILMDFNIYIQKLIFGIAVFAAAFLNAALIKKYRARNAFVLTGDLDA